jgi:hypothetical protein
MNVRPRVFTLDIKTRSKGATKNTIPLVLPLLLVKLLDNLLQNALRDPNFDTIVIVVQYLLWSMYRRCLHSLIMDAWCE